MVVTSSLLLSSILAVLPTLVSAGTCPPKYIPIASTVAQYSQAQSYCSSKYPLPVVTSTVSAPTSTSTSIVTATVTSTASITTTTTQQVSGSTTTTVSVTSTSTVTAFTLITSTTTSIIPPASPAARMLEREAHNEPVKASSTPTKTTSSQAANPKASVWSSLVSKATSIIPTICTCIQTAKTTSTTVTPSTLVTSTVTATAFVTSTAISTAQTTIAVITASVTTTAATVTTTTTSTNTAVQTQYRFPEWVICNAAQRRSCANNGGFTTGVLVCNTCAIFYIQETPVCLGQFVGAGQCTSDNYCLNVGGSSARCVFDPREGNYGKSVCAITKNCNRPQA